MTDNGQLDEQLENTMPMSTVGAGMKIPDLPTYYYINKNTAKVAMLIVCMCQDHNNFTRFPF